MIVVVTIAGSDSGGGAGIQADLKTFEAHGVFGTTVVTSITAQNTLGVRDLFELPEEIVKSQLEAIFDDFDVAAVKTGMLASKGIIETVVQFLRNRASTIPIVVDPVMISTSGHRLLRSDAVATVREKLIPLATLVTPNIDEGALLSGSTIDSVEAMGRGAREIFTLGPAAVLLKGGHIPWEEDGVLRAIDLLYDGSETRFTSEFLHTTSTHGTGCTLSSSIAANLALGYTLIEAVGLAKEYVHGAIRHAPSIGGGNGPLLHGWRTSKG